MKDPPSPGPIGNVPPLTVKPLIVTLVIDLSVVSLLISTPADN